MRISAPFYAFTPMPLLPEWLSVLLLLALALAYLGGGLWLAFWLRRRMAPGWRRRMAVAAVLALFFSLSIIGGHGIAPVPALYWLLHAYKEPLLALQLGLLPLLAQWLLLVLAMTVFHGLRRCWAWIRSKEADA